MRHRTDLVLVSVVTSRIGLSNETIQPERIRRLLELSDEIGAINMRMMNRSKFGKPDNLEERERLAVLMKELRHPEPCSSDSK